MSIKSYRVDVDFKKRIKQEAPIMTQNDTNTTLIVSVSDAGDMSPELLDEFMNITLASQLPNGNTVHALGTRIPDTTEVEFTLSNGELSEFGFVEASLQFYTLDPERFSTLKFKYEVERDLSDEFTLNEGDSVFLQELLSDTRRVVTEMETSIAEVATTIADGPVVSVNGKTGVVEGVAEQAAIDEVSAQLADIVYKQIDDFEYLGLVYPPEFPSEKIPFNLYRDVDNTIKHDFDFDSMEVGAGHIYVKGYNGGHDNNNGLTVSTPVSTFSNALIKANALPESTVVIHMLDNSYDKSRFDPINFTLAKNIIIKSDAPRGKTFMHSGTRYSSSTWVADGTAYKYNRSGVIDIFDCSIQDGDLPKKYIKKNSLAEVQAEEGTWYTDGATVWVRRVGNAVPNDDMALILHGVGLVFNIGKHKLVMRNIEVYMEAATDDGLSVLSPTSGGEFWHENCVFTRSFSRNGLEVKGVNKTYGFGSKAFDNYLDGFNYHANAVLVTNDDFAFEYKCEGFDNGVVGVSNANATTAHDGYTILRVGCIGHSTYGPILADVNGCFSVNYDCVMYNSLRTASAMKAAFYFDATGAVKQGKAYLINCQGGGVDTLSITGDANLPIYIRNFKGRGIFTGSVVKQY